MKLSRCVKLAPTNNGTLSGQKVITRLSLSFQQDPISVSLLFPPCVQATLGNAPERKASMIDIVNSLKLKLQNWLWKPMTSGHNVVKIINPI